ncbi:hypothetical protein C8R45DRAFT_941024 [Mycena sanguinolenta]|nr:hypothetical protein C8R45DRAFT_941024 [Mycena sanguinolenta]
MVQCLTTTSNFVMPARLRGVKVDQSELCVVWKRRNASNVGGARRGYLRINSDTRCNLIYTRVQSIPRIDPSPSIRSKAVPFYPILLVELFPTDPTSSVHPNMQLKATISATVPAAPKFLLSPSIVESTRMRTGVAWIMCAQSSLADDLQDQFKPYFVGLLPSSLVHHRFLSRLTLALHEITDLVNTPAFKRCATYGLWTEFLSVANERLEVLTAFDLNRASRNTKACDNLQYYSQSCQVTDWRHGGHREACNSYGKLFLSTRNDADSTARQRSFLRALVHHDYQKAKPILLCKQIFFKAYPDIGFFIMFNYTEGRVKVQVKSLTVFDASKAFKGVEWKSILSRAAAGGGKMVVHVAAIYEAESARRFVIPLRTGTSAVHDRIQHLSTTLPEPMANWTNFDRESCVAELSPMVTSTEDADVVEVY